MADLNSVIEAPIAVTTVDGEAEGFLYTPATHGHWPGVLHLTDIGGIRQATRDMARRLAAEGYAVLMPNAYYRSGAPPFFSWPVDMADEATARRLGEIAGALAPDAIERDAAAYVDFFASHPSVRPGQIGVVGHCFSGAMALRIAAAQSDAVATMASFHGGNLYTDTPASPHLVLPRVRARLYFAHAVQDRSMPQESIDHLNRALAAWGGRFGSEVYEGALHSWTVPDSPVYHPAQANRAFERLTMLLAKAFFPSRS